MSTTPNINLYKHDNVTTNTDIFDIDKAMNKNWDKLDNAIGELQATTTAFDFKGEVDTLANVQAKPKIKGDVWYCKANKTFYSCNGTNWISVNVGMNLDYVNGIKTKAIQCMQELETPTPVEGENITLNDCKKGKFKSFEVRGNSEQQSRSGKNKLNILSFLNAGYSTTINGIAFTINEDGTVTANGTATENALFDITSNLNLDGTNKKIKMFLFSGNAAGQILAGVFDSNWQNGKSSMAADGKNFNTTNLVNITYAKLRLAVYQGATVTNAKFGIMIAEDVEEYEQYGASPSLEYESPIKSCENNINIVVSNKNMFFSELFDNKTNSGVELKTLAGTNNVLLNGTATKEFVLYSKPLPLNMFKVGKKYTASKDKNYSEKFMFEICENGSSNPSVWGSSITMKESYTKIIVYLQANKGQLPTFNNKIVSLQLEEGDATTIVEHKGQTHTVPIQKPFRAIEDIKDHFIKKGGKYYEEHLIGRYIFKGTETIALQNGGKRIYIKASNNNIPNPILPTNDKILYGIICNHLNKVTAYDTWRGFEGISYNTDNNPTSTNNGFTIAINEFTTAEQYKNWFAQKYADGNPFYIDYQLAEPELIPCTEVQTAALQDIEDNFETYDDCTHIYCTDEVPANIECTYCKDINKVFNNIAI